MTNLSTLQTPAVNAELVLRLGKYHHAKDLRKLQAKLTGTAREIRGLTSGTTLLARIGEQLTPEQSQLLRDAAKLIESVGSSIEHAKEKRLRDETATKARRKAREKEARALAALAFPMPINNLEQKLDVIQLALVLSRAGCFQPFYTSLEVSLRFRSLVSSVPKLIGWETSGDYWECRVASFRSELLEELESHLAAEDGRSVQDRLNDLKKKIQTHLPGVAHDPHEIETIRLWSKMLTPAPQEVDQ